MSSKIKAGKVGGKARAVAMAMLIAKTVTMAMAMGDGDGDGDDDGKNEHDKMKIRRMAVAQQACKLSGIGRKHTRPDAGVFIHKAEAIRQVSYKVNG